MGSRRWVWAASSLVHEARVGPQRLTSPLGGPGAAKEVGWRPVREQEPADALGMPPAPLPPAMQFFIVGGLAVPPPLPADRSSGLEAWPQLSGAARTGPPPCPPAVGQGPGLSSWSAPPLLPRGQERETPPSPAGSKPQGALEGAPWAGGGVPSLLVPRHAPPPGSLFPVSPAGVSPARALGGRPGAQQHRHVWGWPGAMESGAGQRDQAGFTVPLPRPARPTPSTLLLRAGGQPFFGQTARQGTRDSWAVTPCRACGPRTRRPHSGGRRTPFTLAGSLLPLSIQAPCWPRRPLLLLSPPLPPSRALTRF